MIQPPDPDQIEQAAIAWVVRVNDAAFDDWAAFEQWLTTDPAHREAYHRASMAEADMVAALSTVPRAISVAVPVPQRLGPPRRWRAFTAAAIAASVAGLVVYQMQPSAEAPLLYQTAPGEQRAIALADGSSVLLNGDTRLIADGDDRRALTLTRGEALFTVKHDDAHPFSVTVGSARVVDVGTRFNIVRDRGRTRVAVSEGAVDWKQSGDSVPVAAGKWLRVVDGSSTVERGDVAPGAVGGWSQGQVSYDGTALVEVAADLARTLGTPVSIAPALAERPVRGTIRLDGGARSVMPRIAKLLGVHAKHDGRQWRLQTAP